VARLFGDIPQVNPQLDSGVRAARTAETAHPPDSGRRSARYAHIAETATPRLRRRSPPARAGRVRAASRPRASYARISPLQPAARCQIPQNRASSAIFDEGRPSVAHRGLHRKVRVVAGERVSGEQASRPALLRLLDALGRLKHAGEPTRSSAASCRCRAGAQNPGVGSKP